MSQATTSPEPANTVPQNDFTTIAIDAAQEAARIAHVERFAGRLKTRQKTAAPGDVVTGGDMESQTYLEKTLPPAIASQVGFETVGLLGEEELTAGRDVPRDAHYRWVVDPVDGTKQYNGGTHQWSVSVAFQKKDGLIGQPQNWESEIGVIYCASEDDRIKENAKDKPKEELEAKDIELHGKIYWAEKDKGAFVKDLHTGTQRRLTTPSPEKIQKQAEFETVPEGNAPASVDFANKAAPIIANNGLSQSWLRSIGYAAMEVLEGRKAAIVQGPLGPYDWDVAALSLIAKEAGAHIDIGPGQEVNGRQRYHTLLAWDDKLFAELRAELPKASPTVAVPSR